MSTPNPSSDVPPEDELQTLRSQVQFLSQAIAGLQQVLAAALHLFLYSEEPGDERCLDAMASWIVSEYEPELLLEALADHVPPKFVAPSVQSHQRSLFEEEE